VANRTTGVQRRTQDETRKLFTDALRQGATIPEALTVAGRSKGWYVEQRKRDRDWAQIVDTIRAAVMNPELRNQQVPDFPEFCERFLGFRLFDHQLAMFDVLEGRPPRWRPQGIIYEPGAAGHRRVLINIPPGHAKTMTVSISYVLWRILRNPSMSVLIVSKTQTFAAKILYALKNRLTHPQYAELQLAFGPAEGFKAAADSWTATQFYLGGDNVTVQEKDPTVAAVGLSGQIYGNRAQLVVVDDAIVLSNASQWESQQDWLRQEVASRLGPDDQLVVVGTRVAPIDLYRELRNPDHYHDQQVPWTYLGLPAVLEYAEEKGDWVTLWPRSDQPFVDSVEAPDSDGLYSRWNGERLSRVRNEVGPRRWSLVYQQQDVEDDATFDPVCVRGSIDGRRGAGQPLIPGTPEGPEPGAMLTTLIGVDPAVVGNTAMCVYTFDRRSGRRWVMDVRVLPGPTPRQIREELERLVDKYRPMEVVVEANAFQLYLVRDEQVNRFLANRGVPMRPHYTYGNKVDPVYGVASMAPLFGTVAREAARNNVKHQRDNLISLPNQSVPGVKILVDELVSWNPETPTRHLRQDAVMSLWISETRARELISTANRRAHANRNPFLSERDLGRRFTVRLSEAAEYARAQGDPYV
jgi:hypothetical protein